MAGPPSGREQLMPCTEGSLVLPGKVTLAGGPGFKVLGVVRNYGQYSQNGVASLKGEFNFSLCLRRPPRSVRLQTSQTLIQAALCLNILYASMCFTSGPLHMLFLWNCYMPGSSSSFQTQSDANSLPPLSMVTYSISFSCHSLPLFPASFLTAQHPSKPYCRFTLYHPSLPPGQFHQARLFFVHCYIPSAQHEGWHLGTAGKYLWRASEQPEKRTCLLNFILLSFTEK